MSPSIMLAIVSLIFAVMPQPRPEQDAAPRAIAEVTWWDTVSYDSAYSEASRGSRTRQRGQTYPILGRSFDAEWIALRSHGDAPGYFYLRHVSLSLSVEVEQLPIVVGSGMEALSLNPDREPREHSVGTDAFLEWR